jgi:hypothetical protein
MEFKDCTVGTKVKVEGTIIDIVEEKATLHVECKNGTECFINPDVLERDFNQYDPNRKFRKGDIVKPDYKGRKWKGMLPEEIEYEVLEDEDDEGLVLIKIDKSIDPTGEGLVSFSRLVLIESIEEIRKKNPYYVKKRDESFNVFLRLAPLVIKLIYCVFYEAGTGVTQDEARKKAQDLCDEKNREYRELLNN